MAIWPTCAYILVFTCYDRNRRRAYRRQWIAHRSVWSAGCLRTIARL